MTSKEYMQCVTAVDAEWLAELGPMFYRWVTRVSPSVKISTARAHGFSRYFHFFCGLPILRYFSAAVY